MDRVLVEVMLTASLICLSAIITTSYSLLYGRVVLETEEVFLEKVLFHLAATAKGAAANSIITGNNVSIIVALQNPVTVEAKGESLSVYIANSVRSIFLGVEVRGGGTGKLFNITASQNFVTISTNGGS